MAFLVMFDLMDFDADGNVCESKQVSLEQARSNYLYLVSKYNQIFLKDLGVPYEDFFNAQLSVVLAEVENGGDFEKAKQTVLNHCGNFVQEVANGAPNDKALIEKLNENVIIKDSKFFDEYNRAVNSLQRNYIVTRSSGNIFSDIIVGISKGMTDRKTKSEVYKNIIKYNNRVLLAEKMHETVATTESRVYA